MPQALVYVPDAVTSDAGTENLKPLGIATNSLHLELVPPDGSHTQAHASVVINSLGLLDHLQVAATGLEPGKKYRLMLVVKDFTPLALAVFPANIGGAAISQSLVPLKRVVTAEDKAPAMKLEVWAGEDGAGSVVLRQSAAAPLVSP